MPLTKCILALLLLLCGFFFLSGCRKGVDVGKLLNSQLFDSHPSCKPDEPLSSLCALSGPAYLAGQLVSSFSSPGPSRAGKASGGETEQERLASLLAAHASHVLHYFISCLLILEYK